MLYLIESSNYFKIGYTEDAVSMEKRVEYYGYHNPSFRVLKVIEGSMVEEQLYHKYYSKLKLRSEWFYMPEGGIDQVIRQFDESMTNKMKLKVKYGGILLKEDYTNYLNGGEMVDPIFKEYKEYLTLSKMNTLDWNRKLIDNELQNEKKINQIYMELKEELTPGFYTREFITDELDKRIKRERMDVKPMANMIHRISGVKAKATSRRINKKCVTGYNVELVC